MYLDFLVKVPTVKGKITRRKKSNVVYIEYEYDRVYDPSRKYTFPKRVTIGKLSDTDPEFMKPNQNFLKYFPDAELPESKSRTSRSSCLRVGAYFVLRKIIEECSLNDILGKYFRSRDIGLFLDLAVYSIIAENNAAQYYPDYTYNHPLFTEKMKQYSDSTVSDFLNSVTDDQSTGFLNTWNESRNYREKIYISYDSTNKNCQAGDIEMVEFGHPKVDMGEPVFNYAVAYDTHNQEPLFYEKYPGSLNDISQLQFMLDKASGYGYKKIGFILDRGYFSCENIQYMDKCGYSFVIMVKGMSALVNELILKYLMEYRFGPVDELISVWKSAQGFEMDTYELEEKLLGLLMFTSDYRKEGEKILEDYVHHSGKERITGAYLTQTAYGAFVKEYPMSVFVRSLLERAYDEKWPVDFVCSLALLEAYSKEKKLEKKQLCNAEEILQKCVKQGMYFAFFGKLPVSVLSPYQLDDKTFVEYHADPSAKVTLYYALDAGLGNQVKYQTEPLRDLYEGIFAKSFTLFYGETLRYYFESVTGERVNRTQERVLTMNKIEGTPVSKYHMINQMLSARRLDKKKEVFSQVKKYLRQEQYVKKMFVIEKEEQEQIVLKPGGTNERNS